jgi:chromosome segregation ATPase
MRNDTRDELDYVPSLTADQDDFTAGRLPVHDRSKAVIVSTTVNSRALWALIVALGIALGAVGWWSFQQIRLMGQQLVATQENFARISEEASGRIQDISGKVVASESTVLSGNETIKLQIRQLENKVAELGKQLQAAAAQLDEQNTGMARLGVVQKNQQEAGSQYQEALTLLANEQGKSMSRLEGLEHELALQKSTLAVSAEQLGKLSTLEADVQELKKLGNPNPSIKRLEQDLLVLRSEMDSRPAAGVGNDTAEFDAFRAQTSRSINALQAQIQSLQQQINSR